MNFRRIQWIFLIAFIILDLVLVSTLLWGNENFSTSGKQQSQTQLTLKEMKSNSITYPKLCRRRRPIFFPVSPQATKEATEGFAPVLARD